MILPILTFHHQIDKCVFVLVYVYIYIYISVAVCVLENESKYNCDRALTYPNEFICVSIFIWLHSMKPQQIIHFSDLLKHMKQKLPKQLIRFLDTYSFEYRCDSTDNSDTSRYNFTPSV